MRIRLATPADATELVAIYKPYVENTAITFEYDVPSVEEFEGRIRKTLLRYPYLVIESDDNSHDEKCDGSPRSLRREDIRNDDRCRKNSSDCGKNRAEILGYCYAGVFKGRPAYDWAVETSIYIREDAHGRGLGRMLYEALERKLSQQNVLNMNACIACPKPGCTHLDNSSILFHERMGFKLVGTFHDCGYKFSQWHDMVWMEKMLGAHTPSTRPFIPFSQLP